MHNSLPHNFVYLKNIDATILQSVRYATSHNFIGQIMPGYTTPQIICTQQAALALHHAQLEMLDYGYSLIIYDAYRPDKAIRNFKNWRYDRSQERTKYLYYPTLSKTEIFNQGYCSDQQSSHSRASTFDLTIIKKNNVLHDIVLTTKTLINGEQIPFLDDGTIDMGSSFDLFHPVSQHDSNLIEPHQTQHRNLLRSVMKKHNFNDYSKEWWHYTLNNEPYPTTYFDFDIV